MADRPTAYVNKQPGDIIRSGDWNELQIRAREEIRAHKHTGGVDGSLIPRAGIESNAIDGSRIDPAANVTVNTLTTTGSLTVKGDLTVNGKAILGDVADLLAKVKGLDNDKVNRLGDTITGPLTLKSDLQVAGKTTLNGVVALNGPVALGGFTEAEAAEWPKVTWYRDVAKNWDEGLIKHGKDIGLFSRAGFGIHLHESRDWTFFSTNWNPLLGIEGGTGNTKIKGNLSIGTGTTPAKEKLEVAGRIKTDNLTLGTWPANASYVFFGTNAIDQSNAGNYALLQTANASADTFLNSPTALHLRIGNDEKLTVATNGNVGVGTSSPGSKLTVQAPHNATRDPESGITYGGQFAIKGNAPQIDFIDTDHPDWCIHVNSGRMYFIHEPWAVDSLVLHNNGNVGIGTADPTQGKLVVWGSSAATIAGYGYTNRNGASATNTTYTSAYSIYVSDRIAAVEFNAFSDERIKNIQGLSDNGADLQTLLSIEITNYQYKDTIGKGNSLHKKVIAQQVEQVFPQAVNKSTDVIPDIYQEAAFIAGWVELATDLRVGERVRLIADNAEGIYEVLEMSGSRFRTDFQPEGDKIFVFGREVNDFGNVDYDAIAMLNVSATQQLKMELDALRAENASLSARINALEAKL